MNQLKITIRATIVLTILTGLAYPLLVTGLAQALFHRQANGSMVDVNGKTVGSELIGQRFTKPEYFHGRPSAAGNDGYDALASGGSNLGPTNQKLVDRVQTDLKKFRAENPGFTGPIPADLLTSSASGLDPDLSPASAEAQVARVAAARGVPAGSIQALVAQRTQGRQWGLFGEPRVNVLLLNLDLDRSFPVRK
ncbi:MAG: potassium-transporting ATPase subunit KdpC [Acidobacteriia bacterium]|nr:potassium-transporting ATPase subunit KdpC [Terriglobia bacterium]